MQVDNNNKIVTPFSSVGYLTYKRTYSRKKMDDTTEEFPETIERVVDACVDQLDIPFTQDEQDRLTRYHLELKGSVAGRFLWQLGTHTVKQFGIASLQNCAFTVVDSPIVPFTWTMDMLALGAGVGYNIQREHVNKLPVVREWFKAPTRVDHGGADFIIPDSREGWVRFLAKTLKAAFLSTRKEKGTFTYSTQCVRGKGSPIKGFGGVASGPEDLCWGIAKISEILIKRSGKKIRPVDALDIMNIIGHIIVAGNVRRSAQIAIGDCDDIEFLLAKRWDLGNIPSYRAMSNNSVACNDIRDLHEFFWDGYTGKGEPYGLINLRLSRKVGRLGEEQYPDEKIFGYNPCGEQSLEPYETCCLATVFLPNIKSKEEMFDVCELLYRVCKHSLQLPAHHPETHEVIQRNQRMGISLTGILQATPEQLSWMDECYTHLRDFDKRYSELHGFKPSIKLTTVQPSGTLALLPGVTPGVHPGYAHFMIRRITIAADHELVERCREAGYPMEYKMNYDGSLDYNSMIVSFPFAYPKNTIIAEQMTALEQLKWIRRLQSEWSDNAVSCTIYYKIEELPAIKEYLLKHYRNNHKSLSFLLHSNHGFKQAPYQEITEQEYNELVAKVKPITEASIVEFENDSECASGMCPIR